MTPRFDVVKGELISSSDSDNSEGEEDQRTEKGNTNNKKSTTFNLRTSSLSKTSLKK